MYKTAKDSHVVKSTKPMKKSKQTNWKEIPLHG